jgi:acetylornithine deacetylase
MNVDAAYVCDLLADLVRINSINPAFSDDTTNEREIAAHVGRVLRGLGMDVHTHEPEPNRMSVVGRLPGTGGGRSLMLYAHLDTVGVEGMTDPFSAEITDGRMYGRGTYDMKGGLAACIGAVKTVRDAGVTLGGDLLVAAVADEEVTSIGMSEVLVHHSTDAAIVTEPTELEICLAHKGFCWIEVDTIGRAAHGSQFELGVDANMRMGRFLGQLDFLEQRLRVSRPHPLVGPPSLHTGTLRGGTGPSIYAARCRAEIERRSIPGETEAQAVAEIQQILDRLAADDPSFEGRARATLARDAFEVDADAPVVAAVADAARVILKRDPPTVGKPFWMDAALLAAAGIETVVFGAAGAGAHADEESVDLDSVVQLTRVLARTAVAYCRPN